MDPSNQSVYGCKIKNLVRQNFKKTPSGHSYAMESRAVLCSNVSYKERRKELWLFCLEEKA